MNENAGNGLVGHGFCGRLAVLNGEIDRCVIQQEAFRRHGFQGIIAAALQWYIDTAILSGGYRIHQGIVTDPADLKGGVGNALISISFIDLDDLHTTNGVVIHGNGLGVCRVHHHCLRLGSRVDGIAGDGFRLLHHDCPGDARNADLTVGIRGVEALAGKVAVGVIHIAAVSVGDLEFHTAQRLAAHTVFLLNDKHSLFFVIKAQGLDFALFDKNALGGTIQDVALDRLYLTGGHGRARFQISNGDLTRFVGDIFAVAPTDHSTGTVCYQESNPLQWLIVRALDKLLNDQGRAGGVIERERLGVVGIHDYGLRLRRGIDGVAGDGSHLSHDQCTYDAIDCDLAVLIGIVETIAADPAILVRHIFTRRSCDFESDPFQRLSVQRVLLQDDQGAGFGVLHDHGLGVAVLSNDYIGRSRIHNIAVRGLDLIDDVGAGSKIGNEDLTLRIGGEDTILR